MIATKLRLKIFILSLSILLAISSAIGYFFLTEKIIEGNVKIVEGQQQLKEGEKLLARGKTKLQSGQNKLSHAKSTYNRFKKTPYLFVPIMPAATGAMMIGSKVAKNKIAEGNRLVSEGAKKINSGEAQLADGRLQLQQGMDRLKIANHLRITCAIGAIFFTLLSIGLIFYLRYKKTKLNQK